MLRIAILVLLAAVTAVANSSVAAEVADSLAEEDAQAADSRVVALDFFPDCSTLMPAAVAGAA